MRRHALRTLGAARCSASRAARRGRGGGGGRRWHARHLGFVLDETRARRPSQRLWLRSRGFGCLGGSLCWAVFLRRRRRTCRRGCCARCLRRRAAAGGGSGRRCAGRRNRRRLRLRLLRPSCALRRLVHGNPRLCLQLARNSTRPVGRRLRSSRRRARHATGSCSRLRRGALSAKTRSRRSKSAADGARRLLLRSESPGGRLRLLLRRLRRGARRSARGCLRALGCGCSGSAKLFRPTAASRGRRRRCCDGRSCGRRLRRRGCGRRSGGRWRRGACRRRGCCSRRASLGRAPLAASGCCGCVWLCWDKGSRRRKGLRRLPRGGGSRRRT